LSLRWVAAQSRKYKLIKLLYGIPTSAETDLK
jgi:hypothetical protein